MSTITSELVVGTRCKTAIEYWQSDYHSAEVGGYAHIDATLNKDGTYTVKYWDRNWREDPSDFVVVSQKILTREELLVDIKKRNEFIERTIQRYERQRANNNAFAERVSGQK